MDGKQAAITAAKAAIVSGNKTIHRLEGQIADKQRLKDAVPHTEGNNNMTQKEEGYQKQIDGFKAEQKQAQTELDAAQKTLTDTLPKWPDNIPLESLTLDPGGAAPAAKP